MKKIYYFIFIFFGIFFLAACSNTTDEIISSGVGSDNLIFVEFGSTNINSKNLNILKEANEVVTLNGSPFKGKYIFKNAHLLQFISDEVFLPKTSYMLKIDLALLGKQNDISFKNSSFKVEFTTKSLEIDVSQLGFDFSVKGAQTKLSGMIETSRDISLELLQEGVILVDEKGVKTELKISNLSNTQRGFWLESAGILIPIDRNKQFTLKFDAKLLKMEANKEFPIILPKSSEFALVNISVKNADKTSVQIEFSQDIDRNINPKEFLKISPLLDYEASVSGNKITIAANFDYTAHYSISVLAGLKSIQGLTLKNDTTKEVAISLLPPSIAFSGSGVFLPRSADKKVAFKTLNVTKVHLRLKRIYANNIAHFLYNNKLFGSSQTSSYKSGIYERTESISDIVLEKDFDIESKKNIWVQNEVDLGKLSDLSGIFIIELSFKEDGIDYVFPKSMQDWQKYDFFHTRADISKNLIFSNIALIAQSGAGKTTINALDISNNSPVGNAEITAISQKNQVVEKISTDSNGLAVFKNANPDNTLYFLATKGQDSSVLRLSGSELENDGYDTSGVVSSGDIKAFIYTERGVYRPGDDIHMNIIALNVNKPLSKEHPIYLTLLTPRGKKFLNKQIIANNQNGIYYHKITTPKNADTGVWQAKIEIGGSAFYKDISVETVVPNRIKVDIKAEDILDLTAKNAQKTLPFSLQGDYLFGAPGNGLAYDVSIVIEPQQFASKIYRDYVFQSPISLKYSKRDSLEGRLDDKGFTKNSFYLDGIDKTNSNLVATIMAYVRENGGRRVNARKNVLLRQYGSFVGLKSPSSEYISTKETLRVPVIVRDSDDKDLVVGHRLRYKIYRNSYYWWWDYDNYGSYLRSIKTDRNTQVIAEGELISKSEPVDLVYQVMDRGEMFIEVEDTTNGATSGVFVYASDWGDPLDNKKVSSLKIKTDKEQYFPKDTAVVSFESVKGAKALITINKEGRILKRYYKNTDEGHTQVTFPITQDLAPNAYVSVSLLQDYETTKNDRSLRLYGVVPINVINPAAQLDLEIDAPQKILPGEEFEVIVSNKNREPFSLTLAVVDEGLLDLTAFKTPDPYGFFYAKMGLELRTFDTYNDIIGRVFGKVHKVLRAGGDDDEMLMGKNNLKQKGDEKAERFKPVVLYSPPIHTDKKGKAKFKFTMPTYMGSVRVMAIATNGSSHASVQKDIKVSAPVVMMPTIPRSLKVGDTFKLAIELFPTEDGVKKASVFIETKKGMIKFSQSKMEAKFDGKKSQIVSFEGIVGDEIGVENIKLALKAEGFKLSDSLEIDIKAINPYITQSQEHIVKPNETWNIKTPLDFVKGSNSGHIVLSSTPLLSLDSRISWLIRYPYGCIEQTTSSVFPQLFLHKLSDIGVRDKQEIINNINAAINNMQGFQTFDGGFSYWRGGNRSDMWGSNYAGHFLIIAKQMGYYVPEAMLEAWKTYSTSLAKSNVALGIRIYSLYLLALGGNPQVGMMNQIYENNLSSLSNVEKWLLGATYQIAGYSDIAAEITRNLSLIPNSKDDYYKYSYGSQLRDKAIMLEAYNTIYNKTQEGLFQDLKDALQSQDWLSTQTIAYSLLSIANLKQKSQNLPILGSVDINGKKSEFSDISTNKATFDFSNGEAKITSKMPTELYASYVYSGIYIKTKLPAVSKKISIKREFLNEYGQLIDINKIKGGITFWLKLTLSNISGNRHNISNVALTQGLPSGWEIENTRLNNDNLPAFVDRGQISKITYTDIRDDKIMWFFDYNGYYKNEMQIVYVKLNAVTPGVYTLPPAYAEAMYDNSFEARTDSMQVEVLSK